jgi:hypothetical protein
VDGGERRDGGLYQRQDGVGGDHEGGAAGAALLIASKAPVKDAWEAITLHNVGSIACGKRRQIPSSGHVPRW